MTTVAAWEKTMMTFEQQGLWDTIYTEDEMIPFLEFQTTEGTTHEYERELQNPDASEFSDDGDLASSSLDFTEKSTSLKNFYVQTDVNKKPQQLNNKGASPDAIAKIKMGKSWGRKLSDAVINGDSAVNGLQFDGLEKQCRQETRMMAMDDGAVDGPGTAETELTLDRLDEMIDQIEPGRPDALIMNKGMRRKLTRLMYQAGAGVQLSSIDMFGRRVQVYDNLPIIINDYIADDEQYADSSTWGSSSATTIYGIKFGIDQQGFTVLHNGPTLNLETENLGTYKNRNAYALRMVGYVGTVVYSPLTIIALAGIDSSA
jgi:hypothetical protein